MVNLDIRKSIHCNDDYSIFASFEYDAMLIDAIRQFPTRYWNKDTKEWEFPLSKLGDFIQQSINKEIRITGAIAEVSQTKPEINIDFNFKTTPFKHQIEGFNYGLAHDRWLLADEQGLGKTKQVIDIAVAKKQLCGYKHCLIVCGVNGLKWNWRNEIYTHSNETAYILGQKVRNGKLVIGSMNDRLKDVKQLDEIDSYFIITNVETLRNDDIASELHKRCNHDDIGVIAIDEIHKCKNASSQQGKGILKLNAECEIAMTGTPLMNTPLDLYIILKWLGYEKHSSYAFRNHYCMMGGFGGYEVIGYKNMDELQENVNKIMLRRLKEEVLDLPDKLFVDEYVEMTGKQEQIYKEVTAEIKAHIDEIAVSPNPLAQLIRLRQATGYTGVLSSSIQESAKLDRLAELVEEIVNNNKKVIIFTNWTQMIDAIDAKLSTTTINNGASLTAYTTVITGETPDNERQERVEAFQTRDDIKIILGTIGAMGTGLTLTAATTVIFLDEPWNMALKDQAIDRCHRIGTKSNVTIYTLLCKNTIDERIHDIVTKKGAMSDVIIDGKITGNKTELINFLLS